MAAIIPITPDDNNAQVRVALDADDGTGPVSYWFDPYWNSRDSSWYVNLFEDDRTPILASIRLVLGTRIGANSPADFFQKHFLQVIDRANSNIDAAYDDLGSRIVLLHVATTEFRAIGGA